MKCLPLVVPGVADAAAVAWVGPVVAGGSVYQAGDGLVVAEFREAVVAVRSTVRTRRGAK